MPWTTSDVFRQFLHDALANAQPYDLSGTPDTFKLALYNDTITPDQNVAAAASAYGGGVWSVTGGPTGTPQVFEAGQWDAGGVILPAPTLNIGTAGVVFFTGSNIVSGTAADLQNATGALVYDDTLTATPGPADQGVCFNYFGGPASVVNGTFTVVPSANGLWRATL